ncbi:DUF3896 family protein [Neobacillus sp. D3-1R]|uniref:DUF3896 family protein n=1 Tax=Neobacillus sp. D3-1R TaxID=3445778 RepID=UPI003FA07A53
MNYNEIKAKLEALKLELEMKMVNPNLSNEEKENLQKTILNYDYIIELTEMNHYGRGSLLT